jgi:predicted acylesterase/phospholipase RssA
MQKKFKNLVISGGGIKGIAICGALNKLNEKIQLLSTIKTIVGSSIGSYIAFFLALGLTPHKMNLVFENVDFKELQEFDIKLFFEKYGFDEGNKFSSLVKATMQTQNVNSNITFAEFAKIAKYNIIIVGTNINKSEARYFSAEHTPDMEVIKALRISGGYPFAFTPVELDGDLYADGALICPLASDIIPKKERRKTLGIAIHRSFPRLDTGNLNTYIFSVVSCILDSLMDKNIKNLKHVLILSYPLPAMSFHISKEEKIKLEEFGSNEAEKWLESMSK